MSTYFTRYENWVEFVFNLLVYLYEPVFTGNWCSGLETAPNNFFNFIWLEEINFGKVWSEFVGFVEWPSWECIN